MTISRRHLLRQLGAAAAAAASLPGGPSLAESAAAAAGPHDGLIRLDRNGNPYGPSPNAIAAMLDAALASDTRDPEMESAALRDRLARFHSVPQDRVVLGCGSGEILRMAADAFLGPRRSLIVAEPTFDSIRVYAQRAGADIVAMPLGHDYAHDLPAMLARSDTSTGLVYICNPNNPTGSLTRRRDLEAFIRELPETTHVLIDEAYHHYTGESGDYASFIDRPVDDDRVIVARTFSKMYGLAGLRVGYAVASPDAARRLAACWLVDGVNVVAARAAAAALDDQEYVAASASRNIDDRQEFVNQAHARMLKPIDSQTNFVLMNTERPAIDVIERFKRDGILLPPPVARFEKHIRVSLGRATEMQLFWDTWDLMNFRHSSM
jgi:histidinol-phosphate aminotransferase